MSARKRTSRPKQIPPPHKDPEVRHSLEELSAAAHDAIQEVLASYLASPDTLRQVVKEEMAKTIRYKVDAHEYENQQTGSFLNKVMDTAREQAVAEFNNPKNFDLFVEQLKVRYLAELKKELERLISSRAARDAHDTYERAWRKYERGNR